MKSLNSFKDFELSKSKLNYLSGGETKYVETAAGTKETRACATSGCVSYSKDEQKVVDGKVTLTTYFNIKDCDATT